MTRDEAILLARMFAARDHWRYDYLRHAREPDWVPHEWVIDAILVAAYDVDAKLPAPARIPCNVWRFSDSTCCLSCGLAWNTNDPDPPPCPKGPYADKVR
jgi:hypothetical protein